MCFYELHVSMICVLISIWSSKYKVWEPWSSHTYAILGRIFEVRSMFVDKVNGNKLWRSCSAFMARFYKRYLSSKINCPAMEAIIETVWDWSYCCFSAEPHYHPLGICQKTFGKQQKSESLSSFIFKMSAILQTSSIASEARSGEPVLVKFT